MSFRQQLINLTSTKTETVRITQESLNDLRDHIQDEEIRKKLPPIKKWEQRTRLVEESQRFFKPIRKTIYLERKHVKLSIEDIMICSCKAPQEITTGEYSGLSTVACSRKCLNRMVNTECCATFCVAGDRCTNRRFQLQQHSQLYPIKTQDRGWGLAAGQVIRKGQFIIQYIGEVYYINSDLGRMRLFRYMNSKNTYLMSISNSEVIDPTRKGNLARFINHSCDPNCETQKWNVLGEIVIGIFARRNIAEDEELTFDYKFDTHKTWLTQCYCGTSVCRKFLGLVRVEAQENGENRSSVWCGLCREKIEEGKSPVICSRCNFSCHISCIQKFFPCGSLTSWTCSNCKKKEIEEPRLDQDRFEKVILMDKNQLTYIREKLDCICDEDVHIYWNVPLSSSKIFFYVRGPKAEETDIKIRAWLSTAVIEEQKEDPIKIYELKVQKILSFQAFKYLKENAGDIEVEKHENIDSEGIFNLSTVLSFHLTGRNQSVSNLANALMDHIDRQVIYTMNVTQSEAREIENDLISFKNAVLPVELRLSKEKTIISSTHPFFSHHYEERKIVLIGTEDKIQIALQYFNSLLSQKMNNEKETSYNFLLPVSYKNRVQTYKTYVLENLKKMTSKVVPTIIIFDPYLSKRQLTISITGTWEQVMKAKSSIVEDLKQTKEEEEIEIFLSFIQKWIYKAVLQGTVKYIHEHEKLTARKLEATKRKIHLNFWDVYSAELFVKNNESSPIGKFRINLTKSLLNDQEIILILIRLSENLENINRVLRNIELNSPEKAKIFKVFDQVIEMHLKIHRKKNTKYSNNFLNAIENFEIEVETNNHKYSEISSISSRVVELCRTIQDKKKFKMFPTSIGTDAEENDWEPELGSKLSLYLENLQRREIIFGNKSESKQIVSLQPANYDIKNEANLMVGSYEDHHNILYVIFADSED